MLENVNPMLIFAILGVVIVIGLVIVLDPFGFKDRFTNVKERFDGLTSLNKKIFDTLTPMATPNVVNSNERVQNIKPNNANILNSIIFPEIKQLNTPAEQTPAEQTPAEQTPAEQKPAEQTPAEQTPAEQTPAEQTPAEQTPVEQTPVEQTPVEQTNFKLPEMVLPKEETQEVILPSPILAEPPQNESNQEPAPFILPPTVVSDITSMQEGAIAVPPDMTEIVAPTEEQSTFALPSLINTNEQAILPQSSVLTSLEEKNKPVDVKDIVSENQPLTTADVIKQQIVQPVLKQDDQSVTLPANELDANNVAGGQINQFKNARILGAFPLYK